MYYQNKFRLLKHKSIHWIDNSVSISRINEFGESKLNNKFIKLFHTRYSSKIVDVGGKLLTNQVSGDIVFKCSQKKKS